MGSRGKATEGGLRDKSPEAGYILQIILQRCNLKESNILFVNLILQLAVYVVMGDAKCEGRVHPDPTNPMDLPLVTEVKYTLQFDNVMRHNYGIARTQQLHGVARVKTSSARPSGKGGSPI